MMTLGEKLAKKAAYMRAYRASRPDYAASTNAKIAERYRNDDDFRARMKARAKAWYEANRDRVIAASKARYGAKPKKGRPRNERHCNWKGESVGYHALHAWVIRHRGSPSICEHCGTTTAKRFEWANRDHEYNRNLDDFIRLCTSCHRRYDYENGLCEKGGPRKKVK